MKVGFIGLGKLGQSCAEMMAEKHKVIGYYIQERHPTNVQMVTTLEKVIEGSDLIFIAVETPHDPLYDGKYPTSHLPPKDFNYSCVINVLNGIKNYVNATQLIILISTVLPGTIRKEFGSSIDGLHFIYNPYLIAMGTVKWDMVNPEMVIIGTDSGNKSDENVIKLISFYDTMMQNNPRYVIGTWDECECIKIFYNTFISAKVSIVNMIQDVAEKQGNINAEVVCDALAHSDKRIMGPLYMKPGMGDGGGCHPRDNIALRHMVNSLNLGYDLFGAIIHAREIQAMNMAKKLIQLAIEKNFPIIIVGKSYKPLVPYENGSSSILVGHYVSELGGNLYYLDDGLNEYPPKNILDNPAVYLMAHNPEITYGNQINHVKEWYNLHSVSESDMATYNNMIALIFPQGSVVVDPWRKMCQIDGISVIHYGNTRIK